MTPAWRLAAGPWLPLGARLDQNHRLKAQQLIHFYHAES